MLQQAHEQGHDVGAATRALVAETAPGRQPARDLRYRIVSRLDVPIDTGEVPVPAARLARSATARTGSGAPSIAGRPPSLAIAQHSSFPAGKSRP